MDQATKPTRTPELGLDMGYQRDFQLWRLAQSVSNEADASNYRTIAACELQDRNEALVTALAKIADTSNGALRLSGYAMAELARVALIRFAA